MNKETYIYNEEQSIRDNKIAIEQAFATFLIKLEVASSDKETMHAISMFVHDTNSTMKDFSHDLKLRYSISVKGGHIHSEDPTASGLHLTDVKNELQNTAEDVMLDLPQNLSEEADNLA